MDRIQQSRLLGIAATYRMWSAATRGMADYAAGWAAMAEMMSGRGLRSKKAAESKSTKFPEKPAAAPASAAKRKPEVSAQVAAPERTVIEQPTPERSSVAEARREMPPALGSEAPAPAEFTPAEQKQSFETPAKPEAENKSAKESAALSPAMELAMQQVRSGKKKKNRGAKAAQLQQSAEKAKDASESGPRK